MGEVCKMNGRIGFRGYTEKDIISKEAGGVLTFSPTNIVDNQLTIGVKNTYITKEKYEESSEIMVKNGNILFVKTGSTLGKSALVTGIEEDCTVNPQVVVIKVEADSQKILSVALTSLPVQKQITAVKIGGAVPTMTETELKNIDLFLPQSSDERIKIGEYFTDLDNLITLHQRKCDEMKKLKKYMIQKMFPQNGEKVPKIRFAGFSDDWEQRKFGDVGSVSMCKRIFKNETSDGGDIPFYKIGTFGGEPDAYISRELFEEYKEKFSYPDEGDILLSASGTIGRIVEYTGEEAYFQDSNIVWLSHDKSICNKFLKVLYPTVKWDGIEGSTIKRLYNDNFLKTQFMMPKIEEQERLGEYFEQLDHLITLHQQKCDELQNIKQFMLKNMFA